MTQKRFVKCLMALGCERNLANEIAALPAMAEMPYIERYVLVACFVAQQADDEGYMVGLVHLISRLSKIRRTPYYGKSVIGILGGDRNG